MGNAQTQDLPTDFDFVNNALPSSMVINQGTMSMRQPHLGFHNNKGNNVILKKGGRVAERKGGFCKGVAFSDRAIQIDEIVCLQMTQVVTSWSGVLRFGVTNIDPETIINVPKFACPDLTAKDGFWAKAMPERFSVQGNILHFSVNREGDLQYGVNGRDKGIFLSGINTARPMWVLVDIYGNSLSLEFIEQRAVQPPRPAPPIGSSIRPDTAPQRVHISSTPTLSPSSYTPQEDRLRFHAKCGRHIAMNATRTTATRDIAEYSQGYVFTSRPIKSYEKVVIQITQTVDLYQGSLAFGVTCCNPANLRVEDLPEDSLDLIELPDYFVGIKDLCAGRTYQKMELAFFFTSEGELKITRDNIETRTVLYVDNSLPLYFYFDLYGATQAVRMKESFMVDPVTFEQVDEYTTNRSSMEQVTSSSQYQTSSGNLLLDDSFRPPRASSYTGMTVARPSPHSIDDLLGTTAPRVPPPRLPARQPPPPPGRPATVGSVASAMSSMSVAPIPPARPARPTSEEPTAASSSSGSGNEDGETECLICFAPNVDTALYSCGHMCMCFKCATILKESSGTCPICRQEIKDVLKCYKS